MSEEETKSWSIRSLYQEYLEEKYKKRKFSDYWRASDLGSCFRRRFYLRKRIQPSNQMKGIVCRALEEGSLIHWHYQRFFERLGILRMKEKELTDEKYNYSGHFDAIVGGVPSIIKREEWESKEIYEWAKEKRKQLMKEFPNGLPLMLYEIKTCKRMGFMYFKKDGPNPDHILQIGSYLLYAPLKLKCGRILYINKDTSEDIEFHIVLTDQLKSKVLTDLKIINKFWEKGELPPQLPEFIEAQKGERINWKCEYCPYRDYCRGKDWYERLKKNYQGRVFKPK